VPAGGAPKPNTIVTPPAIPQGGTVCAFRFPGSTGASGGRETLNRSLTATQRTGHAKHLYGRM